MSKYVIEGEMLRPGDARVEVVGLANAKAFFADMIVEGARFVTLTEVIDGREYEIGRFIAAKPAVA